MNSADLDVQDAEAGLVVVEGHAFDEAGDLVRLNGRRWLWLLGRHQDAILSRRRGVDTFGMAVGLPWLSSGKRPEGRRGRRSLS